MRQKLVVKTTNYRKPLQTEGALHVLNPYYGIKPQYQRAEVPPGGDCETVGDWTAEHADFTVAAVGAGRVGGNSIRLTQVTADGDRSVYLLLAQPIDVRWARYVGMWFRAGAADVFTNDDIAFYIFTREANFLYANRAMEIDFFETAYTDAGGNVWRYMELDLDRFTRAAGFESDNLSEVWGIGFYSEGGVNTNLIDVDQIEFYTHATGYGPARGNIISVPLTDSIQAIKGYALAWDETAGRVNLAVDNEPSFAGICVDNPSETPLALDYTDPATEIIVVDASLLEIGNAHIRDDDTPNGENVVITAVNRVTNTLTVTAIGTDYEVADNAKISMRGTEFGSIRVDIVKDGIVNMLCRGATLTAMEGASIAAGAGIAPDIDDGAGASTGFMIGKATEDGADEEVIPILLGVAGTSA